MGCAPGASAPEAPQRLRDIDIPQGFDFATTREVTVTADRPGLGVALALPGGPHLYRGALGPEGRRLAVPRAVESLVVTLREGDREESVELPIVAGRVEVR